jgi:hypothetical protein
MNSASAASLKYWASVVELCNESIQIYPADEGFRDVFALGSVVVKSSHLHDTGDGQINEIDYSYADANEVEAIAIAKRILKDVRVPDIYFSGKVRTVSHTLLRCASCTYTSVGQWSPGVDSREDPGRLLEYCMAVPIAKPNEII